MRHHSDSGWDFWCIQVFLVRRGSPQIARYAWSLGQLSRPAESSFSVLSMDRAMTEPPLHQTALGQEFGKQNTAKQGLSCTCKWRFIGSCACFTLSKDFPGTWKLASVIYNPMALSSHNNSNSLCKCNLVLFRPASANADCCTPLFLV